MLQQLMIGAFYLAGQGQTQSPAASPAEPERTKAIAELRPCDAAKVRTLVGRTADTKTVAQAIKLSGSHNIRIVRPGDQVSMDYSTDRITIELDNNNKVLRLSCG
jgi:hypothetical protein